MSKVMVTGINGFVGKHLARELKVQGLQVVGIGREAKLDASIASLVSDYSVCDLTDIEGVANLPLADIDAVISLAGLANVGASFDNPDLYNKINVQVFSLLANRLLSLGSTARVIAVSTGAVYSVEQAMPLTEESVLIADGSPYALSKIAMEQEVLRLRKGGLDCVIVRPFNHIGPGQEPGFLVPDLYQKIVAARKTRVLKVGPLNTRRDYTDVRDVVRAYALLAQTDKLEQAIYNVCSGQSVEGKKILELLLKKMDPDGKISVENDDTFKPRPNDPADLYGSNKSLETHTDWNPRIRLETTLQDFIDSSE